MLTPPMLNQLDDTSFLLQLPQLRQSQPNVVHCFLWAKATLAALRRRNKSKKGGKKKKRRRLFISGAAADAHGADSSDIQTAGHFFFIFFQSSSFAVLKKTRIHRTKSPEERFEAKKLEGPHSKTDDCSPTRFRQCCDSRWPPTGRVGTPREGGRNLFKKLETQKEKALSSFYSFIHLFYLEKVPPIPGLCCSIRANC